MAGFGKVVVITGASRGVGYAIGKELVTRMSEASVYLTTRQKNLEVLENNLRKDLGVAADSARYRFVDLKDKKSISKFVDIVKKRHDRLDIFINNAGIYHKPPRQAKFDETDIPLHMKEVEEIVKTNYQGLKLITNSFLPVMAEGSRIINISSHLSNFDLPHIHTKPVLNMDSLDNLMKTYLQSVKKGTCVADGLPLCAYSVTKFAVNCYTKLLQEQIDIDAKAGRAKKGISVNAICPGTMHTKMNLTREETISLSDAADVISYLATLNMNKVGDCSSYPEMPKGQVFWHDMSLLADRGTERAVAVAQ